MSQSLWQRLFNHRQQTKQAVLILGSGRSGTSVMTKCVNLMGISLGTDNLLAPSKRINPKGYFENKDVIIFTSHLEVASGTGQPSRVTMIARRLKRTGRR
ncbi:hypothetical protein [Lactiplantibacillus plantarum]|uniref:hypothetical protein n=1 Tax=Lactiplantibacillus plantarum TaxID=1590 RepID=UPI0021CB77A3|nr:hypothetical protein [Lactiplantibacillus plantarum]